MRSQIRKLTEMVDRPNVTVEVVPFRAGVHPGMNGSFTLHEFQEVADNDVSFLAGPLGDVIRWCAWRIEASSAAAGEADVAGRETVQPGRISQPHRRLHAGGREQISLSNTKCVFWAACRKYTCQAPSRLGGSRPYQPVLSQVRGHFRERVP
jgi:hypothetical protein